MVIRAGPAMPSIEVMDLTDDSYIEQFTRLDILKEVEEEKVPLIYDLDSDDDGDENDDFIRLITPTEQVKYERHEVSEDTHPPRNRIYIEEAINQHGFTVRIGDDIELDDQEFLRVLQMYLTEGSEIKMKGILSVRTRVLMNMLPKKCNELCVMITARADQGSKLPDIDDYLVTRPLSTAICKRNIIFTNQHFPLHSFREKGIGYKSWQDVEDSAELVCRYKYVEFCDTVSWKVPSQALVRLRKHECDIGITDAQLMLAWRNVKTKTPFDTKQSKTSNKGKMIDLTGGHDDVEETTSRHEETVKRVNRFGVYERKSRNSVTERFTPFRNPLNVSRSIGIPALQKASSAGARELYTYGDICAGAGGATSAAKRAGLSVSFALDHWDDPCETLRINFRGANILNMDIFDFCNPEFAQKSYMRVDVLHISFPCQFYSVAHSRPGKNDEMNEAAGYSVIPLLQRCKPRVVTFEQSPNIISEHRASFEALIHQITEAGYSVRWKIVNFADTGNAQSRNRLFMIASCPGEPLPSFPKSTHGPGLRRYTTVNDTLRKVPRNLEPHMAETVIWRYKKERQSYNGDLPLRGAITCNGGAKNLHPSGKRPFNNQELAQLQGFSAHHYFYGNKTSIMRQIGNAVPGKAATPFFREILESLRRFDQEVAAEENEIIEVD